MPRQHTLTKTSVPACRSGVCKKDDALKGVVFTEFFRHVEEHHGEEMLDDVIVSAKLPNDGAYTSVGTYPFEEMVALVGACTAVTGKSLPETLDGFGQHCFSSWVNYVPSFFGPDRQLFDVLSEINHFHEYEVRKLYPDAELPTFSVESRNEHVLVIGYHSQKKLTDLAVGVIKGAAAHLGDTVAVTAEQVTGPSGPYARLRVELLAQPPAHDGPPQCPHHRTT